MSVALLRSHKAANIGAQETIILGPRSAHGSIASSAGNATSARSGAPERRQLGRKSALGRNANLVTNVTGSVGSRAAPILQAWLTTSSWFEEICVICFSW